MKRRGRFVLEATLLTPMICMLLVYLVFFTLYAHDYAVCAHTALEAGVQGLYQDGRNDLRIASDVEAAALQKLGERLLWLKETEVNVEINPAKLVIQIDGTGSFLPVEGIKVIQELYRIQPCESIRRSRWLLN